MATTSSVVTDAIIRNHESDSIMSRVIEITYTDDTGGDDPSITIGTGLDWTGQGSTGKLSSKIEGWYLHSVHILFGATPPAVNSDLTVKQQGVDLLNGEGTNAVDATTNSIVYPVHKSSGSPILAAVLGALVVAIANNTDNGAIGTIKLILVAPDTLR